MLWRVRFGAILGEFRTEIFETFSRPRHFAIEIARDRAIIRCSHVLQQLTLRPGLLTAHYTMRRVRFGAILGEFRTEFFENFPRPQYFGFEIAPKTAVPHVLQPGHDP